MACVAPAIGTFLHPVGLCYAAEVTHVFPPQGQGLPRVRYRRWGWKQGRVVDDGHRSSDGMLSLRYRGPGCWTTPAWAPHSGSRRGLLLWRSVPGPQGQVALFGEAT